MESVFTVSPMSQNLELKPGEVYHGQVMVINPDDATSDFSYTVEITPYSVLEANEQIDITTRSNYSQIVDWITVENPTGTVTPNETKVINFTINIPENAPAGGQYATLIVTADSSAEKSDGVSINDVFGLASIIYADIAGETVHETEIIENNIPSFVFSTPVNISAMLKNGGNTHEAATFILNVKNNLTGETILPTTEGNDNRFSEIVMPESTRYITREIGNLPMVGVVNVKQTIFYNGETSTVSSNIVICPIWLMILILAGVVGIISLIVTRIRHHCKKAA